MATIFAVFKKAIHGKKVVVVFHNKTVQQQDALVFTSLQEIMKGSNITVETVVGIELAMKMLNKNTLLILDEVDYHLLDCNSTIPQQLAETNVYGVIGFSATVPQTSTKEFYGLEKQGFKIYNSCVNPEIATTTEAEITLEAFLNAPERAKLIYANKDIIETIHEVNKTSEY